MTTKTISIREEVYERLKAIKDDDESFSDIIEELAEERMSGFANIIGKDPEADMEKLMEERERDEGDDEREDLLRRH